MGGTDEGGTDEARTTDGPPMRTTAGEYLLGAVGGLLVVVVLAFLGYDGLAARQGGPRLAVEVTAVTPAPQGFSVGYEVVNRGGETAEQVEVSGELTRDGGPVEQPTASIDYVDPGSRRQGALLFTEDPRSGELEVSVSGYVLP